MLVFMKKKLIFYLLIFLVSPAIAQEIPQTHSVFWQISGNGAIKPSYIFGTHHLHDYQVIKKNDTISSILKKADSVVGEIVINDANTNMFTLIMKMNEAATLKGFTIDSLLSDVEYKDTDKCMKEYLGIGLTPPLNRYKPMFIYQLIMAAKYIKSQKSNDLNPPGLDKNPIGNSMDSYFQEEGKRLKKELRGLETVDDQLDVLYNGYSLDKQVKMLLEMVYDVNGNSTEELLLLNKLYDEQDLSGLLELMQKSTSKEELETLLVNRNKNWLPQIENFLKKGESAFIVVGAGHLPGSFGVIQLLRQKGYTVKPISIKVE